MSTDLDGTHAGRRTPALTNKLRDLVDSKTLWTDYGINCDIIVSAIIDSSFIRPVFSRSADLTPGQPFTSDFPRADIYEMISPDLLHQVIKGTFKDHIVTWICDYVISVHGETRGGAILDDIDQRYVLSSQ